MTTLRIWLYSIALCLLIGWAAVDDGPDEVQAARDTDAWINDTAAQLAAARRGE